MVRPPGWINTDSSFNSMLQGFPLVGKRLAKLFSSTTYENSNAVYMDVRRRWSFGDETVDVVYASHLLEHLAVGDAERFLREAFRVLKPGGVVRLVVPDLYEISRVYVEEFESENAAASTPFLHCLNLHREGQYGENRSRMVRLVAALQGYPSQHKYMYDRYSLAALLRRLGYVDLEEGRYGESVHLAEEVSEVENTAEGVPSVYLEGKKPAGVEQR